MRPNLGSTADHLRVSALDTPPLVELTSLFLCSSSTEKRQLWEQLRIECKCRDLFFISRGFPEGFARLLTLAYSSSFVLALTELVVSALSGRLYSQSQLQQTLNNGTTAGAVSASSKSSHAEVSRATN